MPKKSSSRQHRSAVTAAAAANHNPTTLSTPRLLLILIFLVLVVAYLYQVLRLSSWTVSVVVSSENVTLLHLQTFVRNSKHSSKQQQESSSSLLSLLQQPAVAAAESSEETQQGISKDHDDNDNNSAQEEDSNSDAKDANLRLVQQKLLEDSSSNNKNAYNPAEEPLQESFSACLLVMDENHRLPEWLAYHYYMLPLRRVFIMSDPRSLTDPTPILERWKPYMQIQMLTEQQVGHTSDYNLKGGMLRDHRRRQNKFYKACLHFFQQQNQTWVATHDTDEFLYLDPKELTDAVPRMQKPGSILQYLHDAMDPPPPPPLVIPNPPNTTTAAKVKDRSCVSVLRTYVGSKEEPFEIIQRDIPSQFNASHFETLRYLHRSSHYYTNVNGPPKSLVRVSTIDLTKRTHGVHELFPECSPHRISPPLRIRHYVGSWEAFSSRVDARVGYKRSRETWEYQSQLGSANRIDDSVRIWLSGFIRHVGGLHIAQHLLQGAGQLPPPSPALRSVNWNMKPEILLAEIKRGKGSFAKFLKARYSIETLTNGTTIVVKRKSHEKHHHNNNSHQ